MRLFALLLVTVLFLIISFTQVVPVFAQDVFSPTPTVTPPTQPSIDYPLPYPGLLPDNPLYPLKAARDRIISFLISNPVKKADFDLLQADKRLSMGESLIDKSGKNAPLAVTTISKGQNYFVEAVQEVTLYKRQGRPIGPLWERMATAVQKHQQVVRDLAIKAPSERAGFQTLKQRLSELETAINKLAPRK